MVHYSPNGYLRPTKFCDYFFQGRVGNKLYRLIGIPMGTNCAPLVADFFCYERVFMISLSNDNQADIIEAFNLTSIYLDDLL